MAPEPSSDDSLERLLQAVASAGNGDGVTLRDVLDTLGRRSFGPMLLVPALVIVSPASAVPTVPTLLALVIGFIAVQMILGREHVWLPRALLDRRLNEERFRKVLSFLRPIVRRVDPYIQERMTALTRRPANLFALGLCCIAPLLMPLGEVIPFLTSFLAGSLALFAVAIMFRDGLIMLLGYLCFSGGGTLLFQAIDEIGELTGMVP